MIAAAIQRIQVTRATVAPGNIDRLNVFAQRLGRLWRLILCRPTHLAQSTCTDCYASGNESISSVSS